MNEKMNTKKGKEIYKLRAITVEPAFGDIKENKGTRVFLTRGIKTVKTEFSLVCTASNLKKIWIELQKKNSIMENIIIKNPNASNTIYLYSHLA